MGGVLCTRVFGREPSSRGVGGDDQSPQLALGPLSAAHSEQTPRRPVPLPTPCEDGSRPKTLVHRTPTKDKMCRGAWFLVSGAACQSRAKQLAGSMVAVPRDTCWI